MVNKKKIKKTKEMKDDILLSRLPVYTSGSLLIFRHHVTQTLKQHILAANHLQGTS